MMDYQKELELFLDYYVSDQSSYIRDAVELDKSFHVINVPKLLAVSGLAESYVFRLKGFMEFMGCSQSPSRA